MLKNLTIILITTISLCSAAAAQSDLQITKRSTRDIPGMGALPAGVLTAAMQKQMDDMRSSTTIVYVKGAWMRTDVTAKAPTMTGRLEDRTATTILQCDKGRTVTFDSKRKKYREASTAARRSGPPDGGTVVMNLEVTDTGERAKIFGFEVRHLKQTLTITPGPTSCMKQSARIEMDGWYADLPGFSCPLDMARTESLGEDCSPDVDLRIKGAPLGFAFKETKRILAGPATLTLQEVVVDVQRTTLADVLFAPPAGYEVDR